MDSYLIEDLYCEVHNCSHSHAKKTLHVTPFNSMMNEQLEKCISGK